MDFKFGLNVKHFFRGRDFNDVHTQVCFLLCDISFPVYIYTF